MAKIYQYVRDPDYYVVPLFHDFGDRPGYTKVVALYLKAGDVQWGRRAPYELLGDESCYREVGEIDLDGLILEAIRGVVEKRGGERGS